MRWTTAIGVGVSLEAPPTNTATIAQHFVRIANTNIAIGVPHQASFASALSINSLLVFRTAYLGFILPEESNITITGAINQYLILWTLTLVRYVVPNEAQFAIAMIIVVFLVRGTTTVG
jgi:hypothetical protein